jgi:hypothetical protein
MSPLDRAADPARIARVFAPKNQKAIARFRMMAL